MVRMHSENALGQGCRSFRAVLRSRGISWIPGSSWIICLIFLSSRRDVACVCQRGSAPSHARIWAPVANNMFYQDFADMFCFPQELVAEFLSSDLRVSSAKRARHLTSMKGLTTSVVWQPVLSPKQPSALSPSIVLSAFGVFFQNRLLNSSFWAKNSPGLDWACLLFT